MTNEIEQKKEYTTPQMEIVEMDHQTSLLDGSPNNDGYGGSGN